MAKAATSKPAKRTLPQRLSLEGRRVVVTGAASGIGRATAHAVAELGASLMLTDMASLADVAKEVKELGAKVETLEIDLTADGAIEKLIATGPIDGLAHCAGILRRTPYQEDNSRKERFHRVMDVNLRLPLDLGLAVAEHMGARGGGHIVLIGSVAGRTGGTMLSTPVDYAASKGGVHTVTRWLSRQVVGKRVQVNAVAPGPVHTAMTAGSYVQGANLPRGSMGEPEEIAWLIATLLTPAASYVSGCVLDANGGTYVG
jgi:3-oxoacyl-[acyl-carrier protein] reductase